MFLLSFLTTNHNLLAIRFCRVKVVNSIRLCLGGRSRLLRNRKRTPLNPKIYPSISQGKFFVLVPRDLIRFPLALMPLVRPRPKLFISI
jgi:hypothetical protein